MRAVGALNLQLVARFPFLFGGTFIEGVQDNPLRVALIGFPFLFGGTFIEGWIVSDPHKKRKHFPSFSEGLSLRGA